MASGPRRNNEADLDCASTRYAVSTGPRRNNRIDLGSARSSGAVRTRANGNYWSEGRRTGPRDRNADCSDTG